MTNEVLRHGDCYATLDSAGTELIVGNSRIERRWRIDSIGRLFASSLFDKKAGKEWLRETLPTSAPCPPVPLSDEPRTARLTAVFDRISPVEAESLTARLTVSGPSDTVIYSFQLFPDSGSVTIRLVKTEAATTPSAKAETADEAAPTGIETADAARAASARPAEETDLQEALSLTPLHLRLTQVTFRDRTDNHNELVQESEWLLLNPETTLRLSGCLFTLEDTLTGDGLIFLKAAPLPYARPASADHDFVAQAAARRFHLIGHGFAPNGEGDAYAWATILYSGGAAGRTLAIHGYQRQLRPYVPSRDGKFLSNTWGDRSQDSRVNSTFLAQEIDAAARLGVDVVQIDDGWQKGRTSNSVVKGGVWEGFYAADTDFWQAHPERFPEGLPPLIARAKERGLQFGLWFAPDSSDDFANWQADADRLLDLHETFGVDHFKIDGVKLRTKRGEQNLHAFFRHVLEKSEGHVVFDNDVTAETRPGYFGLMSTGPLFVENRYTDFRRYWPHSTLRNLWSLAQYIDPVRLRMEWLNQTRNTEKYGDDPLAPIHYRPDYLFATVMFGAPLGWFEVSNLPEAYFAEAAPLIAVWKEHREAIQNGTILPIGNRPDGVSWTGFVSISRDSAEVYALIFRGIDSREIKLLEIPRSALPWNPRFWQTETLGGGKGIAALLGSGIHVKIEKPQDFLFVRFTAKRDTGQP